MANVTIDSKLSTNGVLVRPQRFAYANARPGPEDLIVLALQIKNQEPSFENQESLSVTENIKHRCTATCC